MVGRKGNGALMVMRVLEVPMRLIALDGRCLEMTEYAPWPERCGMWEAERQLEFDGARYVYAGCEGCVYVYREVRPASRTAEELGAAVA